MSAGSPTRMALMPAGEGGGMTGAMVAMRGGSSSGLSSDMTGIGGFPANGTAGAEHMFNNSMSAGAVDLEIAPRGPEALGLMPVRIGLPAPNPGANVFGFGGAPPMLDGSTKGSTGHLGLPPSMAMPGTEARVAWEKAQRDPYRQSDPMAPLDAPPDFTVALGQRQQKTGPSITTLANTIPTGMRNDQTTTLQAMQSAIQARDAVIQASIPAKDAMTIMDVTENTLRFAIFLQAMTFIRAMTQVAKLRDMFTGDESTKNVFQSMRGTGPKPGAVAFKLKKVEKDALAKALSHPESNPERQRLKAAERANEAREAAKAFFNAKAGAGYAIVAARAAQATQLAKETARKQVEKRERRQKAATAIQRTWRAFLGRRFVVALLLQRYKEMEENKKREAAAIKLQSMWRGYMARVIVRDMKEELAEFLRVLRKRQLEEILFAYYQLNPVEATSVNVQKTAVSAGSAKQLHELKASRLLDEQAITARKEAIEQEALRKALETNWVDALAARGRVVKGYLDDKVDDVRYAYYDYMGIDPDDDGTDTSLPKSVRDTIKTGPAAGGAGRSSPSEQDIEALEAALAAATADAIAAANAPPDTGLVRETPIVLARKKRKEEMKIKGKGTLQGGILGAVPLKSAGAAAAAAAGKK